MKNMKARHQSRNELTEEASDRSNEKYEAQLSTLLESSYFSFSTPVDTRYIVPATFTLSVRDDGEQAGQ